MKINKIILLLIATTLFIGCTNSVTKGEVRLYCENCPPELNPFEKDTVKRDRVEVLDVKESYVQYKVDGVIKSMKKNKFNNSTYTLEGMRIDAIAEGKSIAVFLSMFLLLMVCLAMAGL